MASCNRGLYQDLKDLDCEQLRQEIKKLRDEIAKRVSELQINARQLPATGKFSIQGHLQQMGDKQARLRRLLNEFTTRGCGGDIGDAWKYATRDEPSTQLDMGKVSTVAAALGVGAMAVAAVASMPVWGTSAAVFAMLALFIPKEGGGGGSA